MNTWQTYIATGIAVMLWCMSVINAQSRFECSTDVWMLEEGTERLVKLRINPSNSAILISNFITDTEGRLDAIAFNHQDGLLYGLHAETWELYSIDPSGEMKLVTTLALQSGLSYEAMTFNITADKLILIGSVNGYDLSIDIVSMESNYDVTTVSLSGNIYASDYAVDPVSGLLFGLNSIDQNIFSLDLQTLKFENIAWPNDPANGFQGLYFDSFGELYVFGTTAGGVASALFRINREEQREIRITTGPEAYMRDFANCPFRSDVTLEVNPKFSFPCNEIEYTCRISNGSGQLLENLNLKGSFGAGFDITDINAFNINATVDTDGERFEIRDLDLKQGISEFKLVVESGDLFAGKYYSSARLSKLPVFLGVNTVSDNPVTVVPNDETALDIRRIDADSVFISVFFCREEIPILDASNFGSNIVWQNGSTQPEYMVSANGNYYLDAQSGCQTTTVVFEVTIANCPYNIELNHLIEPDTLFPCSEAIFYFLLDNETGNEYTGINFSDTLPDGFEMLEIIKNPYGGEFQESQDKRLVNIDNMTITDGLDTIIVRTLVGDLDPGAYKNRAIVRNFPSDLGRIRFSDFPYTPELDSTQLTVLGVESDTSFVNRILCRGAAIELDGSPFGTDFLWFNGSSEDYVPVDQTGIYELQVFSGCEVSYVFYDVVDGPEINIALEPRNYELHLGDSIQLHPEIRSENTTINFEWYDTQDTTMSCMDCIDPFVKPYFDNVYTLYADNGMCYDSAFVSIRVDKTRKIYAPNVFSPKDPGINGRFGLQSPDFAYISEFKILNRWGNEVFSASGFQLAKDSPAWDGWTGNSWAESGVYLWQARIRFLDGVSETFSGTISLVE